jgi:hypothetical protein
MTLLNYMDDGACCQAKAVLAFLSARPGVDSSWDGNKYEAGPTVARWENGREQGYVVCLRSKDYSRQLNIAFFEHRNSDNICAVKWEQQTINSPNVDTAQFGDIYKNKYDISKEIGYGRVAEMADWIYGELESFWIATN